MLHCITIRSVNWVAAVHGVILKVDMKQLSL